MAFWSRYLRVLCFTACALPGAAAAADMMVRLDEARLIKLPEHVATVAVGNPLIADAALQTGGVLVVTGKGYGVTNIIALDRAGAVLLERVVEVTGPGTVVFYRGIDRETYACTPHCERRPTIGDEAVNYDTLMKQQQTRNDQATGVNQAVSQTLGIGK
jgi:hypothetical protein